MSIERSSTAGCRIIIILWFLLASLEQWSPQHTHEEKNTWLCKFRNNFAEVRPLAATSKGSLWKYLHHWNVSTRMCSFQKHVGKK